MKLIESRAHAFSLVEVSVTLGIAAFCLISIFGLLPVGISGIKTATEQTGANEILSEVISDLRNTPQTTPRGQTTTSPQFAIRIPGNPVSATVGDTTLFFTSEGKKCDTAADARYRMTITFAPNGNGTKTATYIRLRASWPAIVPVTNAPNTLELFCALERN